MEGSFLAPCTAPSRARSCFPDEAPSPERLPPHGADHEGAGAGGGRRQGKPPRRRSEPRPLCGHVTTASEASGIEALETQTSSRRPTARRLPEPRAPQAPVPWEARAQPGEAPEADKLRRLLEEERARHFETTRRVMTLLEQLRDEQERAHDFRAQLEMRNVDLIRLEHKLTHGAERRSHGGGNHLVADDFAQSGDFEVDRDSSMASRTSDRSMNARATELLGATVQRAPVLDDNQLVACFHGSISAEAKIPGVTKGGAPRGEGLESQLSWIMALSLPNPRLGAVRNVRPAGILEAEAALVYESCFRAEDLGGQAHESAQRFMVEKALFLRAFRRLPGMHHDQSAKRYSGEEPDYSDFWQRTDNAAARDAGLEIAHSFLELLRNVIVTKITMHSQLPARTCATEDRDSVLVLVTATAKDLLLEADRSGFPTEMEVKTVDPTSLEPCCPKTFYPLLEWYLEVCPGAPVAAVREAYKKFMQSLGTSPSHKRDEHMLQVMFWQKYDDGRKTTTQRPSKRASSVAHTFSNTSGFDQDGIAKFNFSEADHVYSSARKRKLLQEAFVIYLNLRAERGLGADAVQLMDEANAAVGAEVLVNWHRAIGLSKAAPLYKDFRLRQYEERPHLWKRFVSLARDNSACITTPFNGNQRAKLLEGIINRQLDLAQLEVQGYITSIFPLDSRDKIERVDGPDGHTAERIGEAEPSQLLVTWGLPDSAGPFKKAVAFTRTIFKRVPLEEVKNYYGERVAFYFALVDLICKWLILPGVVGAVTFVAQRSMFYDPRTEHAPRSRVIIDIFYACFIAVWGTVVLESWKRESCTLAFHWGQRGINKAEVPRPHYVGIMRRNPITYEDGQVFYPASKRAPWQLLSLSLLLTLAFLEVMGTIFTGRLRGAWVKEQWPFAERAQQLTAILEDAQMTLCCKLGYRLSLWLNEQENLRTGTEYINGLIMKVVCHELWNRFHLYFYIAFLKASREGCVMQVQGRQTLIEPEDMNGKMCYEEVSTQVTIVICVEFAKNAVELIKPIIKTYMGNMFRPAPDVLAVDEEKGYARMAHFCQEAMEKPPYGETLEIDGTFEDYLEIMRLLGHFTLFSLVFPLAPTLGSLLLLVELRVDGFKLFELVRRPLPRNAEDIGNWFHVMSALTWTAMFTNAGLVVFTFGAFDDPPGYFGDLPRWVYFIFLSGALCCFKVATMILIEDVPSSIQVAEEHHAWLRSQVDNDAASTERPQEEVDLAALDLTVDDANTGAFRDPANFGIPIAKIRRRLAAIRKRRKSKRPTRVPLAEGEGEEPEEPEASEP